MAVSEMQREPMSRERVLRAAVQFADREGIEALSMRKLARELGVEAMTLYYYVANKQALVDGMADLVAGEIELPPADLDWKDATRRRAISAHEVLAKHHWATPVWMRVMIGPARMRYMNAALGAYRRGGLSPASTELAFHAVENHIVGYTLQESNFPLEADDLAVAAREFLASLPRDEFPHLAEHVEQHLTHEAVIESGDFEFGLELLLDGIERIRLESAEPGTSGYPDARRSAGR
jgi:AcrR family transcriptional regulator